MKPQVGIALMHEAEFIAAALPLFEAGEIDVLEWSFDTISQPQHEPAWLPLLLREYAGKNRLLAHGVRYSLLSGDFSKRQKNWLKQTAAELKRYPYRHITEHFGFMSSGHFHKGAPLPVPLNTRTLALGRDRLQRLHQVAGIPVGIENLAFAFSMDQVKEQGDFLEKLVEPVQGFIILDLHNLWCQAVNFRTPVEKLVDSYPLHLVKEIHVSGGSWSTVSSSKIPVRRDTHDEAVPEEVLRLLAYALPKCLGTEAVIFERLGNTMSSGADQEKFISDYRAIRQLAGTVAGSEEIPGNQVLRAPVQEDISLIPPESKSLKEQQDLIITLLTNSSDVSQTIQMLKAQEILKKGGWQPQHWTDPMIETAMQLLKKWN